MRRERLKESRGWEAAELESRENLQLPLDKKKEISDYVISNAAGADQVRAQVREVLSRILAAVTHTTG
jgi:dephospho-CoA kinase